MVFLRSVALVAVLFMAVPGARSDAIKWAQDRKHLFVTVSFDCAKSKKFAPEELKFHLECTSSSGKKEKMSFALREHIKPEESKCKTVKAGEELCTLEKKFPHFFDRLAEDPNELKHLKQDWFRWNDEDENNIPDDPYDGVNASLVQPFLSSNITQAVKNGKVVFADVSFPWCSTCGYAKKPFITAARKFASDQVIFARVDAREDKAAADRHNVSCDSTCNFYVYRKDEDHEVVAGEGNEAKMQVLVQAYLSPPVTHVSNDEEVMEAVRKDKVVALLLLKGGMMSKATASKEYKTVKEAARLARGHVRVLFSDKALKGFAPPTLRVKGRGEGWGEVPLGANASEVARGLGLAGLPVMDEYAYDKRELQEKFSVPVGLVWASDADLETFRELAADFRGKIMMLKMSSGERFMLKDFGVDDSESLPAFGIATSFDPTADRYLYEGPSLDKAAMSDFVTKALEGAVPLAHKSEPVPEGEWKAGTVRHLVYKTAGGVAGEGGVFVGVYKAWATGVQGLLATLDKVANAMGDVDGISVAKYDMSKNYLDPAVFPGISEYESEPAGFFCKGDGKPCERHVGGLTQKDLLKAMAKNFPSVKASWEDKVKPRLKAAADAAKEEKERAEREATEAREKEQAEAAALEERLSGIEKIEVGSSAGSVTKQILTEGEGDFPRLSDEVSVHYTGTLLDGTKFDSSRDRGQPFSFPLGEMKVIPCWEDAVGSMRIGERAVLTCAPSAAYGERGAPPKIPPDSTLRFDVELLSSTPTRDVIKNEL